MNFDDYMKKIQYISNILEKNEYAENVLNSKELDIKQDFQYICLSSAANYKLVNEVIARLAQNGNEDIVKENIKVISMSMWKDLFDKNDSIKKIFIENFSDIFENTSILTIREIERFINDNDTCDLVYNSLDAIIKKLCTYDRASLINILKNKDGGIEKIRNNLNNFFQKGEFDITTTYSKILIELTQIQQISKLEILKACNENLTDMLSRETAVDNETNKLLNWLYDAFEETPMTESDREIIKNNIDNAILVNFDYILDKSNYDKSTIKILKQFDCTKEKFDHNKNHFIEKSNKAVQENKAYLFNLNDKKSQLKEITVDSKKIDEIFENTKNKIDKENVVLKNIIENQNSNMQNFNEEKIEKQDENKEEINNQISASTYIQEFNQKKENLIAKNTEKTVPVVDNVQELVKFNIEETDKVINKVLQKTENKSRNKTEDEIENKSENVDAGNNNINQKLDFNNVEVLNTTPAENLMEENKENENNDLIKNESNNLCENIENRKEKIDNQQAGNNNPDMQLMVIEQKENEDYTDPIEDLEGQNIIKRFFKKIKKIFNWKNSTEKIGD